MRSRRGLPDAVALLNEGEKGLSLLEGLMGKHPLFACVISYTKTAEIPGITVAGSRPELIKYTPAADAELISEGRCLTLGSIPATPDGKPTPALITLAALRLARAPCLVVDAGAAVKPQVPFVSLGVLEVGGNIALGRAMDEGVTRLAMERAAALGRTLGQLCDYLLIGESIPGGTTTALGFLMAVGIDARGKVSSSLPSNPHGLKNRVVEEGMKAAGVKLGDLKSEPLRAAALLGDPMIPAAAGLAIGASERVPVILAGGTQMAAVLALIKGVSPATVGDLAIATTRYVAEDRSADLLWLVRQVAGVPVIAVDPGLADSAKPGLRAYSEGFVKEGVGAGGACLAALLRSLGKLDRATLLRHIEAAYEAALEGRVEVP